MEGLLKEKKEYFESDGQSVTHKSGIPDTPNIYHFEGNTKSRMDEIDSRLRMRNPAAQDTSSIMPSMASLQLPGSDGKNQDMMNMSISQFSQMDAMSNISRHSNVTMITLKS